MAADFLDATTNSSSLSRGEERRCIRYADLDRGSVVVRTNRDCASTPAAPTIHYVQRSNFDVPAKVIYGVIMLKESAASSTDTADTESEEDKIVEYMLAATRGKHCDTISHGRREVVRVSDSDLTLANTIIIGNGNNVYGNNNLIVGNHNRSYGLNNRSRGHANKMIGRWSTNYDTGRSGTVRGAFSVRVSVRRESNVLAMSDKGVQRYMSNSMDSAQTPE